MPDEKTEIEDIITSNSLTTYQKVEAIQVHIKENYIPKSKILGREEIVKELYNWSGNITGSADLTAKEMKEFLGDIADALLSAGTIKKVDVEGIKKDNLKLREILWLRHGCTGLYGDDGEMQCGRCVIDFKRDSVNKIEKIFYENSLEELKKLSERNQ